MALSPNDIIELNKINAPWGACYTLKKGIYYCDVIQQKTCAGWFVSRQECNSVRTPPKLIYDAAKKIYKSSSMSESTFLNMLSDARIGLGDDLWGGLYIGIYQQNQIEINNGIENISSPIAIKYALVVDPNITIASILKPNTSFNKKTTIHNGLYNKEVNFNTPFNISIEKKNTEFPDKYLPSIAELTYLFNIITKPNIRKKLWTVLRDPYTVISSSMFDIKVGTDLQKSSIVNSSNYVYNINMDNGRIGLTNPSIESKCLFFRQIILTN